MATLDVLLNQADAAGNVINPRKEDGHGSQPESPSYSALVDPANPLSQAQITNATPDINAYGLVVRVAGGSGNGTIASDVSVINEVEVKNTVGAPLSVIGVNSLVPAQYNRIDLTYNPDGTVATAVYAQGAATVATLSLTYANGNLTSVART